VIPAHNEADSIGATVSALADTLRDEEIDYELIVVDDGSSDGTREAVERAATKWEGIRVVPNAYPRGFGFAVRTGLDLFSGDAVAVVMGDGSDDPADLITYCRVLEQGYDCAFGSRFIAGSKVSDYPRFKLALNRLVNRGIQLLFRHGYNDTTNAFKAYRREVIEGTQPLLSNHFNLTVEMPLKAVVRGYTYGIVPISWTNRTSGTSKLLLKEMGSRYLFIVLYVFLERHLTRGDYLRPDPARRQPERQRRRLLASLRRRP
jgi:dolichol-phosphate mannosyltransferase